MNVINNPIPRDERKVIWPLHGETMLELGNKKNPDGVYKTYFESIGIKHTSVDWNGMDGAIVKDLTKPINLGQFDMVTNIGTTEHVSEQRPVWRNIHVSLKPGGILASVTPYKGYWWWHGEYYPTEAFFKSFAELNDYTIELMYKQVLQENTHANLYVRMKKNSEMPFIMPDGGLIYKNKIKPREWRP